MNNKKVRPIFIYLTILAIILAVFGILRIAPSGKVVNQNINKYSFEEVEKHDFKENCWILVGKKVYDITLLLSNFPNLKDKCGKNIKVKEFSSETLKILEKYEIGKVK